MPFGNIFNQAACGLNESVVLNSCRQPAPAIAVMTALTFWLPVGWVMSIFIKQPALFIDIL
jgi:hypothetical protein